MRVSFLEHFSLRGNPTCFSVDFLAFLLEHLVGRSKVCSTKPIPHCGELAIIVIESSVMETVACRAVDDGRVGNVFSIMDKDGPDVDEAEQNNVGKLLQRKDKGEEVVGDGLGEAIERVEGVAGIWSWHDPFVMRFVESLVDQAVV